MSRFEALDLGRVVAAHGRHVMVETPEGERVLCHPRGKKSELVVGDLVRWQPAGDEGVVEHLEPRRNLFFRQDEWRTKSFAANLDQVLVLVTGEPMFGEMQLARALIAANDAGVPALIGLNKTDLPSAEAARAKLAPYVAMGVAVIELALKASAGGARETLAPLLAAKTTLVLGPSGAGKSTLINLMVPAAQAQVGEISQALGTGRHTTTSTLWYWLDRDASAALIDSPGFQEFGLRHITVERLASLMPDFAAINEPCRFHNCTHRREPGCAVQAAVQQGAISENRYRLYLALHDELSQQRW